MSFVERHTSSSVFSYRLMISTAAAAISATLAGGAYAQPEPLLIPPVSVETTLPDDGYRPGAIRSATKTDADLRNVPQSATVITRQAIDDLDMKGMADVVRYVPGVTMGQGEGHRDAPTMRGNSSTADFFVDGIRDDLQYFRDLYNLERVEILKGPNAMIFGRGGGGGVINRVSKRADGVTGVQGTLEAGSFSAWRGELDAGAAVTDAFAVRMNGMSENSGSFRSHVDIKRYGLNPTLTYSPSSATSIALSYEYFNDDRTVDRGLPSQNGRPYAGGRSTFFGNPDLSYSAVQVHLGTATLEHAFNDSISLRNATLVGWYDKYYQNVFPRNAVSALGTLNLEAYQSATDRNNIFNQTDLTIRTATGAVEHTILIGAELGGQSTDNLRNNSTFNPVIVAANPFNTSPVVFDVPNQNNHARAKVAAFYIQDQIALLPQLDLIAGLRYDHFTLDFKNALNGRSFSRTDDLVSPRAGLVYRASGDISLYTSYSVSFLPSSGDQFSSLDATAEALKPEKFENIEVGLKWDITDRLGMTAAVYRLDRTNTRAPGATAGTIVLTGAQRSKGFELTFEGAMTDNWQMLAGYAYQNAEISRTTSAAPTGRRLPLVPKHSLSLWNKYQATPLVGIGLGVVHQDDVFASISNAVTLPSFTRLDAGLFLTLNESVSAQLNIENLFDATYYWTAHNDNNISPGGPTSFRLGVRVRL